MKKVVVLVLFLFLPALAQREKEFQEMQENLVEANILYLKALSKMTSTERILLNELKTCGTTAKAAGPYLLKLIHKYQKSLNKDDDVRAFFHLLEALIAVDPEKGVEYLLERLGFYALCDTVNPPHTNLERATTFLVLEQIRSKNVIPYFIKSLEEKNRPSLVKKEVAFLLGRLTEFPDKSISFLQRLLVDEDEEVRTMAAWAIGCFELTLNDDLVVLLINILKEDPSDMVKGEVLLSVKRLLMHTESLAAEHIWIFMNIKYDSETAEELMHISLQGIFVKNAIKASSEKKATLRKEIIESIRKDGADVLKIRLLASLFSKEEKEVSELRSFLKELESDEAQSAEVRKAIKAILMK